MAIKKSDAVKFVYVNGNSLPSKVDDATIYIIGGTQELYVGNLKIAASIDVDSALSATSTNPAENQAITKELNKKATIESPTFTGIPNASTAPAGTSTTQIATTAFVQNAITASTIIVDSALNSTSTNPVQNKVIKAALDAKAALASPTFTGTPKAPTAAAGTNTTQIATTAFVKTAIDNSAVTVDSSLSDSSTNPVQNKIIKSALDGKANTGDIPTATSTTPKANGTAAVGSETKYAKGDHVHPSDTTKANLASPTFTGTPKAPTASKGTSTTQLATTAYVQNELVDYIKDNSSAPIAYGTCDTAADVDEKIITLSSDNPDWELEVGSLIAIRFTAKNTATSPTFNVNGTGAKPIGYNTADSNNGWAAGEANVTSLYVYNGTCYMWLSHSVDNNTTYTNVALGQGYATSTPPTSGVAVTATLSSYALTVGGVVVVKFNTNPVPASATLNINSKGAKAIYYRGAAISANTILAGDTATFIYNGSQYHLVAIDRWGQIATTSLDGLMSASDKSKLDSVTATYNAVTGKPTSNQTPAFGGTATISQVSQSTTGQVTVTDRTIKIPNSEASTSAAGLMSSTDKTKLDGIAEGANAYTHPSYTARTGKPTGNQTPAFGGTATVSQITSDATGHVTGATDRTIKIPNTEATTSAAGLMSADDKTKLDGIATGATKVTVDSAMSTTSTNPVQNKVVKQAIDDAIAASDAMIFKGTLGTNGDITALPTTYKTGWTYRVITAGTYAGNVCEVGDLIIALVDRSGSGNVNADWTVAQTNINGAITNITVTSPIAVSGSGSSRALSHANSGVTAAAKGDTSNQTPAFGGTFKVPSGTVNATGHLTAFADHTVTIPNAEATTSAAGLMSSTDKTKLDSITATYTAVTGKPTANQTPAFGGTATISQVSQSATGQVSVTDRTIKIPNATATTSAAGLMSADDKTKLDGIATGANAYTHPSYTARTGVPTANQTPAFGGTFTVNQVNCDATGHVTASTSRTITIPSTEATTSAKGLMSSEDKTKLDGIATGAEVNSITGVKGNAESSYRTGNVNLTPANVGALALTGGNIQNGTGVAYVNNIHSGIKLEETDNGITANVHPSNARFYATLDGSNTLTSIFEHNNYTDGFVGASMMVRNYNTTTEKISGYFGLRVAVDKSGQCRYTVTGKEFKNAIGIAYGTCDTAAATAAKVVTVSGLGYALTSGAIIGVKFTDTNTADNPTLNVNNTGAKKVWYDTALITTSNQKFAGEANRVTFFMYDGTQWVWIGHGANDATGYLPLTGGTVSGATTVQNTLTLYREGTTEQDLPAQLRFSVKDTTTGKAYTSATISAYQDHGATTYGTNMVIQSGGSMILGSGESPASQYSALKGDTGAYSGEDTWIVADSTINLQANANSIANRKGARITTAGAIVPIVADIPTNNVQSVGTADYKWNSMYATTFYGTLSGNASTATEFSANKAVTLTGDVTGTASSKGGWSVATTLANSGATAGEYGPTANQTPAFGATFNVPDITVDAKGRVTSIANRTVKIPAAPTTITGNAGSATKLATGRTIDGVTFDGSAAIVHYGECSTAAGTAAKVVACTSFTLVIGSTIRVKFTVTNTAASPTLNVNSTGAKAIFYKGAAITAGYLIKDHVYEFVYDGAQYCLVGEIYAATTASIGSASAGTAIAADDITAWSAGTLPTLGTAIPADDITAWSAGTAASASVSGGVLTITDGTTPSLSYSAKSIPNVTGVGTLPSLSYTARSIPNISVTNKSVVTGI